MRQVVDGLLANPADDRTLDAWGRDVGAGRRTLSRLFVADTGLTFAEWRTETRVRYAVAELAAGTPVHRVARHVGYRSSSAFIHAFQRVTGHTPGCDAVLIKLR